MTGNNRPRQMDDPDKEKEMTGDQSADLVKKTEERLRKWLVEEPGSYEVTKSGSTMLRFESARVFINVYPYETDETMVVINTWVLVNVPKSAELNEWIAYNSTGVPFATFFLDEKEDSDLTDIGLTHYASGEFLTKKEFHRVVGSILFNIAELHTELHKMFGGEVFTGDDEERPVQDGR